MNILYFLIGCSILIALVFLSAFFWSVKNGQHDDMQTPAMRILFDEDLPEVHENKSDENHIPGRPSSRKKSDSPDSFIS